MNVYASLGRRRFALAVAGGALAIGLAGTAAAQSVYPERLFASDLSGEDRFGTAVAVSGDVAIVGAPRDNGAALDTGSAYIFRFNGSVWIEEQKLVASDAEGGDEFGFSVCIRGDLAIVGARRHGTGGAAYVFRYNGATWDQEQEITASDGAFHDGFGNSNSCDGNVAIVGAWGDDDAGFESGAAYVFRFNGSIWVEEQKLTASDAASGDLFGASVSLDGDLAIVGASSDDDAGLSSGSTYAYRYNGATWVEEQKLTASDAASGDRFGVSVSLNGSAAIVGASDDDDGGSLSGSAYVYRHNGATWVQEQKLTASDAAIGDRFGTAVFIDGNGAIAGAPRDDDAGSQSGSSYVFRFDGACWEEAAKIIAPDGASVDRLGSAVCLSGDIAIMGAPFADDAEFDCGAAYIGDARFLAFSEDCDHNGVVDLLDLMDGDAADCNDNLIPDSCDIASGFSQDLNGDGVPDECEVPCPGDLNGDGVINVLDLIQLLSAWGVCG